MRKPCRCGQVVPRRRRVAVKGGQGVRRVFREFDGRIGDLGGFGRLRCHAACERILKFRDDVGAEIFLLFP